MTREPIEVTIKDLESLEQELCEDCVSRSMAINKLKEHYFDEKLQSSKDDPCVIDAMTDLDIRIIKALPSVTPTQKWIPVSERLPKMREQVICCEKDKVFIGHMTFEHDGVPVFSTPHWNYFYVTAWMPLPEPYKAEMESE